MLFFCTQWKSLNEKVICTEVIFFLLVTFLEDVKISATLFPLVFTAVKVSDLPQQIAVAPLVVGLDFLIEHVFALVPGLRGGPQ
jgi:hypothetical protein